MSAPENVVAFPLLHTTKFRGDRSADVVLPLGGVDDSTTLRDLLVRARRLGMSANEGDWIAIRLAPSVAPDAGRGE